MNDSFTYNELTSLLNQLNEIFACKDLHVSLNVYGGYVMCAHGMRMATEDIDVVYISSETEIDKAVKEVARKNKINNNWLNQAVKEIVLDDMVNEDLYVYLQFSNITINFPSEEQLLAMKLYSARVIRDLDDAVMLSKRLKIASEAQLDAILKKFFSVEKVRERNRSKKNIIGRFKRAVIDKLLNEVSI